MNEEYTADLLHRLNHAEQQHPANRVVDFDETCWKRHLGPEKVLAEKGSEAVKLKIVNGEKETDNGHGWISAAGEKLRFWIPARGKTDACHAKFKALDDVIVRHTENGCTNEDMMGQYLEWLSNEAQGGPIFLVLDMCRGHRTVRLQQQARDPQIKPLFVPAGGTHPNSSLLTAASS
jgi:hypothetical protein